jgi:prepilin-type N-terminal cleavage/methylation domain-containing protein
MKRHGFTLIELSIVLVIVGLLAGSILVGNALIDAANIRGAISQLSEYNTAANTFRLRYNAFPGDINKRQAAMAGLTARGNFPGQGDGDGLLKGSYADNMSGHAGIQAGGETGLFWVDLSATGLISGRFSAALVNSVPNISGDALNAYFPKSRLGKGNYVMATSFSDIGYSPPVPVGNAFVIHGIESVNTTGSITRRMQMTVAEAFTLDSKMDDGKPYQGRVLAMYLSPLNFFVYAKPGSSVTCVTQPPSGAIIDFPYSMEIDNGANRNCGLFVAMQ